MPVTVASPTETYSIIRTQTDFSVPSMTVTFNHYLNGDLISNPTFVLEGAAFTALFGVPSDGTTPLASWLTTHLYNAAISAGLFTGTVVPDSA